MADELTPNVDVPQYEIVAFQVAGMIYGGFLRPLLIEAVDDANHMYDERALAMCDAAFAYQKGG